MKFLFYKAAPKMYLSPSMEDSGGEAKRFLKQRFAAPQSMLNAMRTDTGICLREQNWLIYGYIFGLIPCRITLRELFEEGYVGEQKSDFIGSYYTYL